MGITNNNKLEEEASYPSQQVPEENHDLEKSFEFVLNDIV